MKKQKSELVFLPLGGTGEIGMNLNLYGYGAPGKEDWIIVDMGVTFGEDTTPGIDVMMADPTFIIERKDRLKAIIFTHAHEDHVGAIAYLWEHLRVPVYATPFTATIALNKLREAGLEDEVDLRVIPLGGRFDAGPFNVEYVRLTHSIPEPNALAIRTEAGMIFHTGDWKFDPGPVIGEVTDFDKLDALGREGVRAMICDSTNVFTEGNSGSEEPLFNEIKEIVENIKGRAVVTCFASNVARLVTLTRVAEATGRSIVLAGRSLYKMTQAARDNGYMDNTKPFLDEKDIRHLAPDQTMVICTGSQGEPRAALARMASGMHPHITLGKNDTVVFSSRTIPGNERSIGRIQNALVRQGAKIVTSKEAQIHVSGHPARNEIRELFGRLSPEVVVPVHGEYRHLQAHAELAHECGIEQTFVIENGNVVKLGPDNAAVIDEVPCGRWALEGNRVVPLSSEIIKGRTRVLFNGGAIISVAVDDNGGFADEPMISTFGLLDPDGDDDLFDDLIDLIYATVENASRKVRRDDEALQEALRLACRRWFRATLNRRAVTHIHLLRV